MSGISGATLEKVTSKDVVRVDSQAPSSESSCCDAHSHIVNDATNQAGSVGDAAHVHASAESSSLDQAGSTHGHTAPHDHTGRHRIVSMDTLGIFASTLCLIHCLAMPLVVAFLPVLGLQFLEGHGAHQVLAGFVVIFGLCAILPGYLKHRKPAILSGLVVGLAFVLTATFGYLAGLSESFELPLITVGNLILVMSHFFNRKLCKCAHH